MFQIADEQTFEDGQVIWEEGSFGDWIYLIQAGKVELSKMVRGQKVVIDRLQADEVFGEIGYILESPRTFTARAIGPTTLGIIDRDFLDQEYNRMPDDFKVIMRSLARRVVEASENVNLGRQVPRTPKVLSLAFKSRESLIKAVTGNASSRGLLIRTPKPLAKGEKFSLKLQMPDGGAPLQIECDVAWSRTQTDDPVRLPVGMGLRFVQINSADLKRLEQELAKGVPTAKT